MNCFISENRGSNGKISRKFNYEENGCLFSEIRAENIDVPIVGWCKGDINTGNVEISYNDEATITFNIYDYL